MSRTNRPNVRQMPLRMLWDTLGTVRLTGIRVEPDGTMTAINATMEGTPDECVEFVREATGTDDATAEIDATEPYRLPVAGEGGK